MTDDSAILNITLNGGLVVIACVMNIIYFAMNNEYRCKFVLRGWR